MLIMLTIPNVEEMLVGLQEVLQKPKVRLKGRTLEVTERLFECCNGGDEVDRSAAEGRQRHIRSSGNAQRISRERPKDLVVAPPRRILNYILLCRFHTSIECRWVSPIPSHRRGSSGLLSPWLHTLGTRVPDKRHNAGNVSAGRGKNEYS